MTATERERVRGHVCVQTEKHEKYLQEVIRGGVTDTPGVLASVGLLLFHGLVGLNVQLDAIREELARIGGKKDE